MTRKEYVKAIYKGQAKIDDFCPGNFDCSLPKREDYMEVMIGPRGDIIGCEAGGICIECWEGEVCVSKKLRLILWRLLAP